MRRRALLGMTAAAVLGGTTACSRPAALSATIRSTPTPAPTVEVTPNASYNPDDPVGVVRAALDHLRGAGAARVEEWRELAIDGERISAYAAYHYHVGRRALQVDTTVWLADGIRTEVRFGLVGDSMIMRAPVEWEQPPDTWYRLDDLRLTTDDPTPWFEREHPPVGSIEALAGVTTPAWLASGDARSSKATYELVLPGPSGMAALPEPLRARLAASGDYDDLSRGQRMPVSVTVRADGRLDGATLDLSSLTHIAVLPDLPDTETFVAITSPVELSVPYIGGNGPDLPDPASALPASALPQPAPQVVAA